MIATMVYNPPTDEEDREKERTTLIVVPAALLLQVRDSFLHFLTLHITLNRHWRLVVERRARTKDERCLQRARAPRERQAQVLG